MLRPNAEEVARINKTTFRPHFLYWPKTAGQDVLEPIRLSGENSVRREVALIQMLNQLAMPDRSLAGAVSEFQRELDDIPDPQRRRILLLVGSYDEARRAFQHINTIPEWKGRVTQLISDDADLDDYWMTLRRGELATYPSGDSQILVAPLLAVERGHNIVLPGGKAAIGTVYFLARPHPRPDDITLAIQAINDWAVQQVRVRRDEFAEKARAAGSPNAAGLAFRREATRKWMHYLTRRMAWSSLRTEEQIAATWDQLVVMWQVIGRLVRGGEAARVVYVDAAFAPMEAKLMATDTPQTSLLTSMEAILKPYFDADSLVSSHDRSLVKALYEPLYKALLGRHDH